MGEDDRDERGPGRDHHDHAPGFPSPLDDLAIAERSLAAGELKHAAHHLSCALAVDPNGAAYLSLAQRLFERAPDPLALTEVEGTRYFGMVALRALAHRERGELDEAFACLMAVVGTRPDVPFTEWISVFAPDDDAVRALDPERLARSLDDAQHRADESAVDLRFRPLVYEAIAALGARASRVFPQVALLAFATSRALRSIGRTQEALQVASAEHARAPSYLSAVFLAGAERARGDREAALAAFREALRFDPEDLAVRLDIGDLLLELGRHEAAATWYDQVLAREPGHGWAGPSALYARWLDQREPHLRDALEQLADAPAARRARELVETITPFHGFLPARAESTIASIAAAMDRGARIRALHVSSLEAPSAIASVRQAATERWGESEFSIDTTLPPGNDPREPLGPVAFPLWRYEGFEAHPVMPAPSAALTEEVAALAGSRFHARRWAARAAERAPRLGADAVEGLLACALHPPARPPRISAWAWRFRAQVASAMLVAFADTGWQESGRRRALLSLVHGPLDWTTTAGIVALTQLAHEEPLAREEISAVLAELSKLPPSPIAFMCALAPLSHCRLQLPDLDEAQVQSLRRERARLERDG